MALVQIEPGENLDFLPKSPPALEYDRSGWHVSRRQWRALMLLTLLNTVLLGWFVIGPQSTQFIQTQWKQWQARRAEKAREQQMLADQQACLDHPFPQGLVIYQEEPRAAQELVLNHPEYKPIPANSMFGVEWVPPAIRSKLPSIWVTLTRKASSLSRVDSLSAGAAVFIGKRVTPNGHQRLVVVLFGAHAQVSTWHEKKSFMEVSRSLEAIAIDPAKPGTECDLAGKLELNLIIPPSSLLPPGIPALKQAPVLTLLAGQADPRDPSHLVLPYKLDGVPSVIDVWVKETGLVLKARVGRPYNGTGTSDLRCWILADESPATRAAQGNLAPLSGGR